MLGPLHALQTLADIATMADISAAPVDGRRFKFLECSFSEAADIMDQRIQEAILPRPSIASVVEASATYVAAPLSSEAMAIDYTSEISFR